MRKNSGKVVEGNDSRRNSGIDGSWWGKVNPRATGEPQRQKLQE